MSSGGLAAWCVAVAVCCALRDGHAALRCRRRTCDAAVVATRPVGVMWPVGVGCLQCALLFVPPVQLRLHAWAPLAGAHASNSSVQQHSPTSFFVPQAACREERDERGPVLRRGMSPAGPVPQPWMRHSRQRAPRPQLPAASNAVPPAPLPALSHAAGQLRCARACAAWRGASASLRQAATPRDTLWCLPAVTVRRLKQSQCVIRLRTSRWFSIFGIPYYFSRQQQRASAALHPFCDFSRRSLHGKHAIGTFRWVDECALNA